MRYSIRLTALGAILAGGFAGGLAYGAASAQFEFSVNSEADDVNVDGLYGAMIPCKIKIYQAGTAGSDPKGRAVITHSRIGEPPLTETTVLALESVNAEKSWMVPKGRKIDSVNFQFDYPRYGARHQTTVCFRGLNERTQWPEGRKTKYMLQTAALTYRDHRGSSTYLKNAGLKASATMACDTQNVGITRGTPGGVFPDPAKTEVDRSSASGPLPFSSSSQTIKLYNGVLLNTDFIGSIVRPPDQTFWQPPRFCFIEYIVDETKRGRRSANDHNSGFSSYTKIEDVFGK